MLGLGASSTERRAGGGCGGTFDLISTIRGLKITPLIFFTYTLQPEIIAKLTPKTLFHVTESDFPRKIDQKTFIHVIL